MIAIFNGISVGRPCVQTDGGSLLLDQYGTDVLAAYSLRKLSSSYGGSAIRVRRDTDNAEQDIGFDSNGDLDTSALTAFVPDNGYVVKWYDQSGNSRDGTQTTAIFQFSIVTSGVVETSGGVPAISGGTSGRNLVISSFPTTSQPITTFDVYAYNGSGTDTTWISRVDSTNFIKIDYKRFLYVGILSGFGGTTINQIGNIAHGASTTPHVFTRMMNGASSIVRVDQVAEGTISGGDWVRTGAQMGPDTRIGTTGTPTFYDKLSEIIIFGADKTSDFTGIEDDMKTYYSTP
tara:strand:+ start:5335 stop:6204 length:870 start_codon:yes stop_codon:yes gene_type:complete